MLFKNWKGNIIGSWSRIFLKMLLSLTVFHKFRQGNSFCYLEYAYLRLFREWRGVTGETRVQRMLQIQCCFLLLSPMINQHP